MKLTVATLVATVALLGDSAVAAPAVTSSSFYLQAHSKDSSIDGKKFGTCHIGAGQASICLYNDDVASFQLNSTKAQVALPPHVTAYGRLAWTLPATPQNVSLPMGLSTELSTNVAGAGFNLGNVQRVGFNKKQQMGFVSYYNDTTNPPSFIANGTFLQRWQVCESNVEDYVYETLSWVYGTGKPTQPSCKAVTVTRVFV